jgi:mono/diheme cytochrome c family protein
MFRAYDKHDGKVLWEQAMPTLVTGAPMTYLHNGRQYVVVTVSANGKPAEMVALTLDGHSENGAPPEGGVLATTAPVSATAAAAAIEATPAELALGQAAYERVCAACHGATGTGGVGPALTGRSDFDNIIRIVTEGQGEMPPLSGALPPEEIDAVVKHVIRTLGVKPRPPQRWFGPPPVQD